MSTDITYVPIAKGFLYLAAVLDWHSRYVLSWQLSNTLDVGFCLQALADALRVVPAPHIFSSDQGSQFTSLAYEQALLDAGCRISRDGRGRATDNAFIERLWRTAKWEHIYLNPADDGHHLQTTVAIIGAGVAGLMLATFLHQAGVACVVLERHDRAYLEQRQRAGVVEARGVQMFERWGLAEQLLRGSHELL